MNFVRIASNAIVEGPSDLVANWIGPSLEANKDGSVDQVRYVGLNQWPAGQLALLGWVALSEAPPAPVSPYQTITPVGISLVAGVPTRQYSALWPALTDLLAARRAEVDALLVAKSAAGLTLSGVPSPVQMRDGDRANIDGAVVQALLSMSNPQVPWPSTFAWRLADNSTFALATASSMIAFGAQISAAYLALRAVGWKHKDDMDAMTDPAQIAAYDITAGW